ncbi:MAG: hypothetical protein HZY76_10305 [Anaerolineae bacterium]|nr:MAG: hypothetical protein HZY76_10305 [Anaerolineae bacterium]
MTTETRTAETVTGIRRFIPILSWLPRYDRSWLTVDVIAGLTLWGLVVPEAMAYAGIAGLPPQAGLYTLLAALLVYALLGTSRHLVVQATSATAALLASSVAAALVATAAANASDPATYQAYYYNRTCQNGQSGDNDGKSTTLEAHDKRRTGSMGGRLRRLSCSLCPFVCA